VQTVQCKFVKCLQHSNCSLYNDRCNNSYWPTKSQFDASYTPVSAIFFISYVRNQMTLKHRNTPCCLQRTLLPSSVSTGLTICHSLLTYGHGMAINRFLITFLLTKRIDKSFVRFITSLIKTVRHQRVAPRLWQKLRLSCNLIVSSLGNRLHINNLSSIILNSGQHDNCNAVTLFLKRIQYVFGSQQLLSLSQTTRLHKHNASINRVGLSDANTVFDFLHLNYYLR